MMAPQWQPTSEEVAACALEYDGGATLREIGQKRGVSYATIRRHIGGIVAIRPPRNAEPLPLDIEEICAAYRGGATMDELALAAGVSRTPIMRALRVGGVEIRACARQQGKESNRVSDKKHEEMRRLRESGLTLAAIAERLGVSRQAVHQALKKK